MPIEQRFENLRNVPRVALRCLRCREGRAQRRTGVPSIVNDVAARFIPSTWVAPLPGPMFVLTHVGRRLMVVVLALVWLSVGSAHAQETRAGRIAVAQAEKARQARAYAATRAERKFVEFKDGLLRPRPGIYPVLGGVYSGGGLTLGVGYRRFYGDRSRWDIKGLYSIKNYKLFELRTRTPSVTTVAALDFGRARRVARCDRRWHFHGLGIDSPKTAANFRMKQTYFGGELDASPVVGGPCSAAGSTYEDFRLEEGSRCWRHRSRGATTPPPRPDLVQDTEYLHTRHRPRSTGARRRTTREAAASTASRYTTTRTATSTYSFDRLDGEVVQHLPILRENWVLSFRGRVQTTLDDDDTVPYFLLPSLGSGSTLRGYAAAVPRSPRAADDGRVALDPEPPRARHGPLLRRRQGDAAVRATSSFNGLKSDWGIGVRFHGPRRRRSNRDGARSRRMAPGLLRRRGILTGGLA